MRVLAGVLALVLVTFALAAACGGGQEEGQEGAIRPPATGGAEAGGGPGASAAARESGESGAGQTERLPLLELGAQVYDAECLICHQADGSGVPDLQPALVGSDFVEGPPEQLIEVILLGSDYWERERLGNVMPRFTNLSDREIAAVTSYVRAEFVEGADPVELDTETVAALRDRLELD